MKRNLGMALTPFIDDVQTQVLADFSKFSALNDDDLRPVLIEALRKVDVNKYKTQISKAISDSIPGNLDADSRALVVEVAFDAISGLWRVNDGLASELVGYIEEAGHLDFLHSQSLRTHTRKRLGVAKGDV